MTLIELIVAMLVLSVGLLGTLTVAVSVLRQQRGGMQQTVAAGIAQARLDSLTSIGCAALTTLGGSATQRGVTETWTVTDGRNVKFIDISITVPGRKTPVLYETVIPCREL